MDLISGKEIIQGIRDGDHKVLEYVYDKHYKQIQNMVKSNSGSDKDAEDLFQDAIVIAYKKVCESNFTLTSEFGTFLYSISRLLWLKELKQRKFRFEDELEEDKIDWGIDIEKNIEEAEEFNFLYEHISKLPYDCQDILKYYFRKIPLKEITEKLGLSSVMYLKKKKYKCKERLIQNIKSDKNFKAYR